MTNPLIIMLIAYLVFHLACSILSYGILFAYFQTKWPEIAKDFRREDMGFAAMISLMFGPIALFVGFFATGLAEHGIKFR